MIDFKLIKEDLTQIIALTEKNIRLSLRFKFRLFMALITPIIGIIMPLIVIGSFVQYNADLDLGTKPISLSINLLLIIWV